jgi:beta-mannanase
VRKLFAGLLATAFVLGAGATSAKAPPSGPMFSVENQRGYGAYDPPGDFRDDKNANIEHLFLPWEDVDLASLGDAEAYALARGRSLLITVEPWTWSEDWRISADQLRDRILSGGYDANMAAICQITAQMKVPVTIRWGQEMEDKASRFTWAGWNPEDYIAAYRRVVDVCRKEAPNVTFMWSPKGVDGLEKYYPGDDYVDVVGLSVFGLQRWDLDKYGKDRSFAEALKPGYDRVVGFNKPVVVAEFGAVGDAAYVDSWTKDARYGPLPDFGRLTAVVYFNQREVYPWPDGYGLPDWRVTKNVLTAQK